MSPLGLLSLGRGGFIATTFPKVEELDEHIGRRHCVAGACGVVFFTGAEGSKLVDLLEELRPFL